LNNVVSVRPCNGVNDDGDGEVAPDMGQEQDFQDGAAFIDGQAVPMTEARIPITDTGFTRSDLTYDVVSVWDGAFFRLEDHLDRFLRNCQRLRLTPPHDRAEIRRVLIGLIETSRLRESYVEMICTRGPSVGGSRDPRTFVNRFYAFAIPYVWILKPETAEGMDAVVSKTSRRIPTDSVDPTVKNFHWGDLTKGLFEAYDRGADQALLLDHQGNLTEGPGYNVFAVIEGRLLTPSSGVLEGITRRTILEIAEVEGIETRETEISQDDLRSATELFATSTAGGVMPITRLDGEPVDDGQVGGITERLRKRYWAAHTEGPFATRVLPTLPDGPRHPF
jgi:branched-chain amino acid aminotransferase